MSAVNFNMTDSIIKSALVQQIQDRDVDIARSSQQAQQAFQAELARQAEEVVENVMETEQNGVDEDSENETGGGKKKKRRRSPNEPEDDDPAQGWTMGPDDDGRPHTINIIA